MKFIFTEVSANKKTGPIPVSMSQKDTCPDACPFKQGGCYASNGPINLHWTALSKGLRGISFSEFLTKIKRLHVRQLWRHNSAGDFVGSQNKIDKESLSQIVVANKGKHGFGYTHYPVLENQDKPEIISSNREAIVNANQNGFTINLSGNNIAHADKLKALGIGPVVAIVNSEQKTNFISPAGNRVVICPATNRDNVSCARCGLCQRAKREYIIAFPAHGISFKKVNSLITNAA